jgi:hypothetical protein
MQEQHSIVAVAVQPPRFNLLPIAGSFEGGARATDFDGNATAIRSKPGFTLSLLGSRGSARSSPRSTRARENSAGQKGATDLFATATSVLGNLSNIWGSGTVAGGSPKGSRKKASPKRKE